MIGSSQPHCCGIIGVSVKYSLLQYQTSSIGRVYIGHYGRLICMDVLNNTRIRGGGGKMGFALAVGLPDLQPNNFTLHNGRSHE